MDILAFDPSVPSCQTSLVCNPHCFSPAVASFFLDQLPVGQDTQISGCLPSSYVSDTSTAMCPTSDSSEAPRSRMARAKKKSFSEIGARAHTHTDTLHCRRRELTSWTPSHARGPENREGNYEQDPRDLCPALAGRMCEKWRLEQVDKHMIPALCSSRRERSRPRKHLSQSKKNLLGLENVRLNRRVPGVSASVMYK